VSEELINAIVEIREDDAIAITNHLLSSGAAPMVVLDACKKAMDIIGKQYEEGKSFIPELMMAGEMMTAISGILKPHMEGDGGAKKKGTIVFGTVEGDIHDIAKDIVVFMLDINGFEVIDLGVDVSPAKFVEAAKKSGASIVGLSGFLTLAFDPMKETIAALKAAGLNVKTMIGGGQIDEQIKEYTGADAWGRDAMVAVALANEWTGCNR